MVLWPIKTELVVEPDIAMTVDPGGEFNLEIHCVRPHGPRLCFVEQPSSLPYAFLRSSPFPEALRRWMPIQWPLSNA